MIKCEITLCVVLHRPPSGTFSVFREFLQEILECCVGYSSSVVVIGDFSVDALFPKLNKQKLTDVFLSCGYENVIHVPTMVTKLPQLYLIIVLQIFSQPI